MNPQYFKSLVLIVWVCIADISYNYCFVCALYGTIGINNKNSGNFRKINRPSTHKYAGSYFRDKEWTSLRLSHQYWWYTVFETIPLCMQRKIAVWTALCWAKRSIPTQCPSTVLLWNLSQLKLGIEKESGFS